MIVQRVCWTDEDFDRRHAPGGESRFEAAVRRHLDDFDDALGDIAPVTFAVCAWRLATSLDPGYVRWHRRITWAACHRSPWDGSLICEVTLAGPWPAELARTRQWTQDRGWQDWPRVFGQYVNPTDRDLTRVPHLRTMLVVEAPVPLEHLPAAPEHRDDDVPHVARRAVTVVARELNDLLAPMLTQLEAGVPTDS